MKKHRTKTTEDTNSSFLSKLEQLRNFVSDSISENDVSSCLRQCSYNVNVAAEQLMTGQYKKKSNFFSPQSKKRPNPPSSSPSPTSKNKNSYNSKKRRPTTTTTIIPAPVVIDLDEDETNESLKRKTKTKTKPKSKVSIRNDPSDTTTNNKNSSSSSSTGYKFLLTKRWTVGYSNVRRGSYHYRENLQITADKLVRFQGMNIEGTLLKNLGELLVPLLLQHCISVKAVTLMEDDSCFIIGTEIPLELSIYITRPKLFFQQSTAYPLLQWAQYGGDIPILSTIKNDDDDDKEEKTITKEAEDSSTIEEESFQADEAEEELTNQVLSSTKSVILEQESDPIGFQSTLRPYQKQALFWMMQREQLSNSLDMQDDVWSELFNNNNTNQNPNILKATDQNKNDIVCDCGPVMISQKIECTTIDGEPCQNRTSHSLWQARFLYCETRNQVKVFFVNELTQAVSLQLPNPLQSCRGGILADAMGLGKTIMLLSLILKTKEQTKDKENSSSDDSEATLIITPLSLLRQWEEEITTKTNLSHYSHYGDNLQKKAFSKDLYDVVLTTYGTLQSEYRRSKGSCGIVASPLLSCKWKRVILDEAHGIKNPTTLASQSCCAISAQRRWSVTGTPIQNSIQDVYGYLKFLHYEPWCQSNVWKRTVTTTNEEEDEEQKNQTIFSRVRRILSPILLRRTKDTLDVDGKPIVVLPPIEHTVVSVQLSEPEREFYNALLNKSISVFDGYLKSGQASKSWFAIFSLLQRLRQACNHVALTVQSRLPPAKQNEAGSTPNKSDDSNDNQQISDKFMQDLLNMFGSHDKEDRDDSYYSQVATSLTQSMREKETWKEECAICLDQPNLADAICTPCAHVFCKNCILSSTFKSCPVCMTPLNTNQLITFDTTTDGSIQTKQFQKPEDSSLARQTLEEALRGHTSSKLNAIRDELQKVWEQDGDSKVLIFSQFLGFLDLLQTSFLSDSSDINCFRLDGQMSLEARTKELQQFQSSVGKKCVFLISMKAGGVGINLVAASTVFIVDPWWNAAVEDQCIHRIHRIGQRAKVVRVRKFVTENTVEEKIVQLQQTKKQMASGILDINSDKSSSIQAQPTLSDFKNIFGL